MNADELAAKAKQNLQDAEDGKRKMEENIAHFQNGVTKLLDDVTGWLEPFIKNGSAKIQRQNHPKHDTTVNGRYDIESAEIQIGTRRIQVKPDFLYGIGGCCYVDVTGFKEALILSKDAPDSSAWITRKGKRSAESEPFERDFFLSRVAEIL